MEYPKSNRLMDVYLIHFDRPYHHAQHYIGTTNVGRVEERFKEHVSGRGANLTRVVASNNIPMRLARVWENVPRFTEMKLKGRSAKPLCPICQGKRPHARGIVRDFLEAQGIRWGGRLGQSEPHTIPT